MHPTLTNILLNAPLMVLIATVLLQIVVEAAYRGKGSAVYVLTLAGIVFSGVFAALNLQTEGESFSGMVRYGGYANYFGLLFLVSAFITTIISRDYFTKLNYRRGEFYILLIFATIGMMLIASANDLIVLFLGIELMSVCLYVLAGFIRIKDRPNEAALKYFLLGAFSTGFLLYGITLIYGATGTTNLTIIKSLFSTVSSNTIFLAGAGLVLIGFSFKAASVPFHMWAPDVYEGAPTPVTAFMSTGAKAAAFAALVTVFIRVFDFMGAGINQAIACIAAASMILGNIVAIAQSNIKRMLAYSSIAHAGYMLSGIAAATVDGQIGVMFYLAAYTLMNLGVFSIVSLMEKENDKNLSLSDYTGLSKRRPLLALLMAVFLFALAGIPPFAGFFGKYYVFLAAVKANMVWLAVVGVLTSVVSAYYYLRVVVLMYFKEGEADLPVQPSIATIVVIILCAVAVLLLGLFPSAVVQIAQQFL
jgi:NADH-quinone oxidoreductase subunit N